MSDAPEDVAKCHVCSCKIHLDQEGTPTNGILRNRDRLNAKASCKKPGAPLKPLYCCHDCSRLMGRIYRLQQKDPSLVGLIDKLTKDDKAKFYADSKELLGDNLVAKIRATSQEVTESSNFGSSHFKGVWLDEDDLNAKYETKPFQLECVKEKARTMIHPTRGCTMWEDLQFTTEASNQHKRTTQQYLHTESEEKVKKPRIKVAAKVKAEAEPKPDRAFKPLTDKGREKNLKFKEKSASRARL